MVMVNDCRDGNGDMVIMGVVIMIGRDLVYLYVNVNSVGTTYANNFYAYAIVANIGNFRLLMTS